MQADLQGGKEWICIYQMMKMKLRYRIGIQAKQAIELDLQMSQEMKVRIYRKSSKKILESPDLHKSQMIIYSEICNHLPFHEFL